MELFVISLAGVTHYRLPLIATLRLMLVSGSEILQDEPLSSVHEIVMIIKCDSTIQPGYNELRRALKRWVLAYQDEIDRHTLKGVRDCLEDFWGMQRHSLTNRREEIKLYMLFMLRLLDARGARKCAARKFWRQC